MDNLKSAIADKILDLSTSGGDEMRIKLEKINRFRDFADACRSLIQKYPAIESELLRMVENNDFDTKIASSRVDTIIRLSENNTPNNQIDSNNIQRDITELEDIKDHLPPPSGSDTSQQTEEQEQFVNNIATIPIQEESEPEQYLPEDIDYEEVKPLAISDEEKEYVPFEEVVPANSMSTNTENPIKEVVESNSNKETIKKGLLICGVIAVIIALIFIIKFVINNWEIILWIIGGLIVLGIAGIVIKRNRK
ncbi:hypothetical protein G7051_16705 [Dysgonomonas sp. HDW5B]|uniref:hypothetical protein n=1 Tax=Dysgonomonas sp. HDW5B TaxID=2714927 RepID=UPI00140DD7CE|nr:hypothetical protein [Dysgonomonas sp. HDW5B]QIK55901.1 hypothetical protein G7051_16705 [Dysgonomonas sp. HDW5B]